MSTPVCNIIVMLTVSGEEVSKVDGKGDPVLADERLLVAPDTDVHGASTRLRRQPGKVDRVTGESVNVPTLPFIGGISAGTLLNVKEKN